MLKNKRISDSELEELAEKCIQDLPKEKASECIAGQRYKIIKHVVGTGAIGFVAYMLGLGHSMVSNLERVGGFAEDYLLNETYWERGVEGVKFITYAQPEAIVCGLVAGFIAHKILKRDYVNYNKEMVEKYSGT